jgi:DNA-directed RNA polymerase alpha subunit
LPLQLDPSSFEGLELTGKISRLVRIALQARGIERLDDLERISLADLLRLPNIGRRSATALIDLYAERKRSHKGRRADQ